MVSFWAWYVGGLGLATVAVGFVVLIRRPLGVSGAWNTVTDPDTWRRVKVTASQDEVEKAMMAATIAEFGELPADLAENAVPDRRPALGQELDGWDAATFLLAVIGGGALSTIVAGCWGQSVVPTAFAKFFGHGYLAWGMLFAGGLLAGLGVQLQAGCTSGHGLMGCSRRQPGSLLSTACFFGTAIVVALAMAWGLS